MSNVVSEWRLALMAHLRAELQDGTFDVVAGERDGKPSRDRKLACVFAPPRNPLPTDTSNVNFARPAMIVRAWTPLPKTPRAAEPPDPEPVEQLMVDLSACLQQIQTPALASAIDGFLSTVTQVVVDYDDWGVEATLVGWTGNPAVRA